MKNDSVVLEIDLNHEMRINQRPVALAELQTTLYAIFSGRTNKNMFIRGDRDLNYGSVFEVLDIAKRSGVGDIALLDKPSTKGATDKPSTGTTEQAANAR